MAGSHELKLGSFDEALACRPTDQNRGKVQTESTGDKLEDGDLFLEVEDEIGVGLKWSPALPFIRAAVVIQYQGR